MLSPPAALVYTMVVAAEADDDVADLEVRLIGDLVDHLPAFRGMSRHSIAKMAATCSERLTSAVARDDLLLEIAESLSPALRETAYALARDVIAADARLNRSEVKILELLAERLGIDPSSAHTIERAAEIRHRAA